MTPLAALLTAFLAVQTQPDAPAPIDIPARLAERAPELAAWPHVTLSGYAVAGRRPAQIRRAINRGRPSVEAGGQRYDASTVWRYSSRWRTVNGQCDPASSEVTVAVTVTLPFLEEPDRLSRRDRTRWDAYFARLSAHELNHARLATAGVETAQAAMRAASDCDGMAAALQKVSEEVVAASREYDRVTDHGKREGAVYP